MWENGHCASQSTENLLMQLSNASYHSERLYMMITLPSGSFRASRSVSTVLDKHGSVTFINLPSLLCQWNKELLSISSEETVWTKVLTWYPWCGLLFPNQLWLCFYLFILAWEDGFKVSNPIIHRKTPVSTRISSLSSSVSHKIIFYVQLTWTPNQLLEFLIRTGVTSAAFPFKSLLL